MRDSEVRSGFPWLTLRERPEMAQFAPSFAVPDQPDHSAVWVRTPAGASVEVVDPALGEALGARALKCDRGLFDALPLSLISVQTIQALGDQLGAPLDPRRFRPNLLVDAVEGPFAEDGWVGAELQVGDAVLRVDRRDGRCVVITVDPDHGRADPRILRRVAQDRQGKVGVYGSTVRPGWMAVGDAVFRRRVVL